jgi:hypothetical protein
MKCVGIDRVYKYVYIYKHYMGSFVCGLGGGKAE